MTAFDFRTVMFSYVIGNAICVLVMASLWRQNRFRYAGLNYWLADFVLQLGGVLLVVLRGTIPDLLSIVGGGTMVIGGTWLLYLGLLRYVGLNARQTFNIALLVVFVGVHLYFTYVERALLWRTINISFGLLVLCAQCAWLLLVRVDAAQRRSARWVGVVMVAYAGINLLRIPVELSQPPVEDVFSAGQFAPLMIIGYHMLFFALTFGLVLMVNRRLIGDLERDVAARAASEEALRLGTDRLQRAEVISRSGNWELHLDSQTIIASAGALTLYGLTDDTSPYQAIKSYPLPEFRPRLDAALRDLLERDIPYDIRFRIRRGDTGELRDIHSCATFDRKRRIVFGVIHDITDRVRDEAELRRAASVFSHAREGIVITDAAGTILEVNAAFSRITGYSRDEALEKNPRMLQSGRQGTDYYAAMWHALLNEGHWSGEIWNRRKDGGVYAEILTISAVKDATDRTQNYVALFTDITPMKEHQQQLEYIAHFDALTGLPNRVLLADRLQQAMAHSQRHGRMLAVVYLDLDGFKAINDFHGHDVGDELLIVVAQRMRQALRDEDTLARIGGDEFVALLADLDRPQDCEPALLRLLKAAADPITLDGCELQVSASIGVTQYPQDSADADQLLRHADQAMYQAKLAGKNRYHLFDVAYDEAMRTLRESLEHINRAIEQSEFVLFYQPKVNMRTGAVVGAEALIRWQHPAYGLLSPAAFLPIVEGLPVAAALGDWVIDTALAQMSDWRGQGLDLPVSVNIGGFHLLQPGFADRLAARLAIHSDVPPAALELEILETSALDDLMKVSTVMRACRHLGVRFALDDFGTGYSSLTYLKRLPAETLKIDQSFVRDMLDDPEDLAIVEGVIGLASAFNREVIAEGVESVAHGELLLPLGCEMAQGFGIAPPMPATDMPGWIARWRPDPAWSSWRERALSRDEQERLFAEVSHRRWQRQMAAHLAGEAEAPPLDADACRLGHWLADGEAGANAALIELHDQIHALGHTLAARHSTGDSTRTGAAVAELASLHQALESALHARGATVR